MVLKATPASFRLIILLLFVFKTYSLLLNKRTDCCLIDVFRKSLNFCPKRKDNMNMGLNPCKSGTGSEGEEKYEDTCNYNPTEKKPKGKKSERNDSRAEPSSEAEAESSKEMNEPEGKEVKGKESGAEPSTEGEEGYSSEPKQKNQKLKDLGYKFVKVHYGKNVNTELRHIKTGERFEFDVFGGDRWRNQKRYEELGEAVTEYVYDYLEEKLDLDRISFQSKKNEKGFFFVSKNAQEADKLMILIHGSGAVRAGQWARSLIINESFESGTMVPYIERATQEGYGIIITNGNQGSQSPQDHFVSVWNKFIKKAKAEDIVIVAHSFGGVVVHHGLRNIKEAIKRIKAVAFTDSVHSFSYKESGKIKAFFKNRTRNWVSSMEPVNKKVRSYYGGDYREVSAGTTEHVWTSYCAKDSVFEFFKEKLEDPEQGEGSGCSSGENAGTDVDEEGEEQNEEDGQGGQGGQEEQEGGQGGQGGQGGGQEGGQGGGQGGQGGQEGGQEEQEGGQEEGQEGGQEEQEGGQEGGQEEQEGGQEEGQGGQEGQEGGQGGQEGGQGGQEGGQEEQEGGQEEQEGGQEEGQRVQGGQEGGQGGGQGGQEGGQEEQEGGQEEGQGGQEGGQEEQEGGQEEGQGGQEGGQGRQEGGQEEQEGGQEEQEGGQEEGQEGQRGQSGQEGQEQEENVAENNDETKTATALQDAEEVQTSHDNKASLNNHSGVVKGDGAMEKTEAALDEQQNSESGNEDSTEGTEDGSNRTGNENDAPKGQDKTKENEEKQLETKGTDDGSIVQENREQDEEKTSDEVKPKDISSTEEKDNSQGGDNTVWQNTEKRNNVNMKDFEANGKNEEEND